MISLPILLIALAPTPVLQFADHPGYSRPAISAQVSPRFLRIARVAEFVHGVPVKLLAKLHNSETSGRVLIIAGPNEDGTYDIGPMGINSAWVYEFRLEYGWFDPFDLEDSVMFAAWLMAKHYRRFHDWPKAVAAYKAGPGRVVRGEVGPVTMEIAREVAR